MNGGEGRENGEREVGGEERKRFLRLGEKRFVEERREGGREGGKTL